MMRLGVCAGFENAGALCNAGFDYVEAAASGVAAMDEAQYKNALALAKDSPIPFEAYNLMVPGAIRLTGPEVDDAKTLEYLERMFGRIAALGAKVIVFGSGGARRVPDGFDRNQAYDQLVGFLRTAGGVAAAYGIDIAIEPLNHTECNILNSVSEAMILAAMADHPRVRVLADIFHVTKEYQSFDDIRKAGAAMAHTHVIRPFVRRFPRRDDSYDYRPFFEALRDAGYEGRMSIEGVYPTDDPAKGLREAFLTLDALRKEVFSS